MSINLKRVAASAASVLALAATATVVSSTAAQAATYNGVCGSGYSVIDRANISGGTVFLTYNSSNGRNCVVTVRNSPGARMSMGALVSLAGDPWNADQGDYTTYAGPVRVSARNACIDWGGYIGDAGFSGYGTHCG